MKKLISVFSLLLIDLIILTSCNVSTKVISEISPQVYYKKDMVFTINGVTEEGVFVSKFGEQYKIDVKAQGDLDLFRMTSCHTDEVKERAWNVKTEIPSGLFGWGSKKIDSKNEIQFTFKPRDIERDDCPIVLKAIEIKDGRHSDALIGFETPKHTLKSTLYCNGRIIPVNGVGICQTRMELKQRVVFENEVLPAENNPCGVLVELKKEFDIFMPRGECTIVFMDKDGQTQTLTLYGYEQIAVRKLNEESKQ